MFSRRNLLVGGLAVAGATAALWGLRRAFFPEVDLTQARPLPLRPFSAPELVPARAEKALALAKPCHRLNYSEVVHALRFLGPHVPAAGQGCYSGATLLALLLDDQAQRPFFPDSHLLEWTSAGPRHALATPGNEGDSHYGYSLSVLAELEIPLSMPLRVQSRWGTIRDLLAEALADFSWEREWEWCLSSFARLLPPGAAWTTTRGDSLNLDKIAGRVLAQPYEIRECYGTHALMTLVTLLRADEMAPSLRSPSREAIHDCLDEASRRLVNSQHPSGLWGKAWWTAQNVRADTPEELLIATGHTLEWLSLCPEDLRPPPIRLRHALEGLVLLMLEHGTGRQGILPYAAYTHAARALHLWLGQAPVWDGRRIRG